MRVRVSCSGEISEMNLIDSWALAASKVLVNFHVLGLVSVQLGCKFKEFRNN